MSGNYGHNTHQLILNPNSGATNSAGKFILYLKDSLVGSRGQRIHQHHQANLRKGSQSGKQNHPSSGQGNQRIGNYSGANNLLMQNYPIDMQGNSNQNYQHTRMYSHHDANDHSGLAGKFKKKNGRLV